MFSRRFAVQSAAAFAIGLALFSAPARADDTIRIGLASPGPLADAVYEAVSEAKAQGLTVKVIEFTDWITPNEALAHGDIDVNYYQTIPYLENAAAAKGYKFISVGVGTASKLGLYSKKHKSFAEVPDHGTVAIANDPVNGGRGLVLLERAGLITLKPGLDYKATVTDITANPKHLKIIEVAAQQLPRAQDDVDIAEGYAHLLKDFGIDPNGALLFDTAQQRYALQFIVNPDGPKVELVRKFVAIYQNSPRVKEILKEKFGELIVPAW